MTQYEFLFNVYKTAFRLSVMVYFLHLVQCPAIAHCISMYPEAFVDLCIRRLNNGLERVSEGC